MKNRYLNIRLKIYNMIAKNNLINSKIPDLIKIKIKQVEHEKEFNFKIIPYKLIYKRELKKKPKQNK